MEKIIAVFLIIFILWALTVKKFDKQPWFIFMENVIIVVTALFIMLGGYVYYFFF
jgi:hypothetical protein